MSSKTWIRFLFKPELREPLAIVGSPGLRSVGQLVIEDLVRSLKANQIAELYSSHFPILYQTSPSYSPVPEFPGEPGVIIDDKNVKLPRIEFYYSPVPSIIIVKGYHANFYGQYEVAEKVLDFFEESGVKKIIVVAGYGHEGEGVCCAATNLEMLEEMKKFHIEKEYVGPLYGFSGLVFGLATLRGMSGVCLFGRTKPNPDYPEDPDPNAARNVLEKLQQVLQVV